MNIFTGVSHTGQVWWQCRSLGLCSVITAGTEPSLIVLVWDLLWDAFQRATVQKGGDQCGISLWALSFLDILKTKESIHLTHKLIQQQRFSNINDRTTSWQLTSLSLDILSHQSSWKRALLLPVVHVMRSCLGRKNLGKVQKFAVKSFLCL